MAKLTTESFVHFLRSGVLCGLRHGSSRDDVVGAFGEPPKCAVNNIGSSSKDSPIFYYHGLLVFFEGDVVSSLTVTIDEDHQESVIHWGDDCPEPCMSIESFFAYLKKNVIAWSDSPVSHIGAICYTEGGVFVLAAPTVEMVDDMWISGEKAISSFLACVPEVLA